MMVGPLKESAVHVTDLDAEGLRKLNSATQYPSILTYHELGERGRLTEQRTAVFGDGDVEVTEKIDGTNARILIPSAETGAPLIGSRTELLHHLPDLIANPAQGIVDATRAIAHRIAPVLAPGPDTVVVVFGEVFGGKASSGSKNYSTSGAVGFRVFDIARVPVAVLEWDLQRIAQWRDGGGQEFVATGELAGAVEPADLPLVPSLAAGAPPESVVDTHAWLRATITSTLALLDDTGKGAPEGVVVRTADRSVIAKIRFEDYERTAKARR